MRRSFVFVIAIMGVVGFGSVVVAPALAKTAGECNADYAANKDSIKASGQTKKDYVAACRAGTANAPAATPVANPTPAAAGKSAKDCEVEYSTNKVAIKAGGQKKKDFITTCRAGTEVIPTAPAAAAPAATPSPAPAPQASPTPAPVTPKPTAQATAAGGSSNEAKVRASCPSDTVVWVNTRSGVYHFAGTHNYGTTKQGEYMCEAAAKAAGDRGAENEKHP